MGEVKVLVINILVVFTVAFVVNLILRKSINRLKRYNQEQGTDFTKLVFIKNSLGFIIFTIATIIVFNSIPALKTVGVSMLAGAGVLAAIIGFASQAAFSNIISGVFIVLFKPFRIGDALELKDGSRGIVNEITFRHTVIRDYQNKRIIIPNSTMNNETIVNCTIEDENIKKHIYFSVAYSTNLDDAIAIIQKEVGNHPNCIDIREPGATDTHKVEVFVTEWAGSAIVLRANAWTTGTENAFALSCDVLKSVKEQFDIAGIEIPYPYRNVVLRK
mgnify:CR=1 FL=1